MYFGDGFVQLRSRFTHSGLTCTVKFRMVPLGNMGGDGFEFGGGSEQRLVQACVKLRFDFTLHPCNEFLQFQETLSSIGVQDLQSLGSFFRAVAMNSKFFLPSLSHFRKARNGELFTLAGVGLPEIIDSRERVPEGLIEA